MTEVKHDAPWHLESYTNFINKLLPDLIASRLPLEAYSATIGDGVSEVELTVGGISGRIAGIPAPDNSGVFHLDKRPLAVVPLASCEELDVAVIRCVGEQALDFIEPRLGEAPSDLEWNDDVLRSWLPLDKWVTDFLNSEAQAVDTVNWIAGCEHLRRVKIDVPRGQQRIAVKGQLGRACQIMTPEGPNIGIIRSLAIGAEIRDGRIVVTDDSPRAALSMTTACIPLLHHDDSNRSLMGANMMRQWIPTRNAEPAIVRTGGEPRVDGFWCGWNLLTAFVFWGPGTYEDGIILSESCAAKLGTDEPLEPGDKLSNRHGTKGVVGRILPDDRMPHLPDGTPVELVYSFIGLHTRMNCGQVREAVLGKLAKAEGKDIVAPSFTGPSDDEIRSRLAKAKLPESGMETLLAGKDGAPLERPSTVGWVYWGLTWHLARKKLHILPNRDAERFAGQRRGEMEYWSLRNAGAYENVLETFNTCSAERDDADQLPARLAEGPVEQSDPPTPMFLRLRDKLAAGGVKMEIEGDRVSLELAAPEGEKLTLACAVEHPWLRGHELTQVGAMPGLREYERLAEANEQTERVLADKAPETLAKRSGANLERHVQEFFRALLGGDSPGIYLSGSPGSPPALGSHIGMRGRIVLGGRMNFSARSVIAPGLDLSLDQVAIPDEMAWRLFGPVAARDCGGKDVDGRTKKAAGALDKVLADSWVLINRAPTLNETAFLAFRPVRIPGRVVRIHPLICAMINADFDGDQLAVYAPVTSAAQKEAGEKLTLAAHLERDPGLIGLLCPKMEALWGLAKLSLDAEGQKRVQALAGRDLVGADGFITSASLRKGMAAVLREQGIEKTLVLLNDLMQLGFEAARASGASMSPFMGESLPAAEGAALTDADACGAYMEEMDDLILSRTDYDSDDIGPQLLAVKSGARGSVLQLRTCMLGTVIADIDRRVVPAPHGFIGGLTPEELFTRTVGASRGLGAVIMDAVRLESDRRRTCAPRGFSVLARALRSMNAGAVLARAAAAGEGDPLTDPDARLFVGLRP